MPNIIAAYLYILVLASIRSKLTVHVCIIGIVCFFSLRTTLIPDTEQYIWIYENPFYPQYLDSFEHGYLYLNSLFYSLTGADFSVFYNSLMFISLEYWYYATRKILCDGEYYGVLLLLFMSFFGFFYLGVTTRNALALLMILHAISIYLNNPSTNRKFFFLLIVFIAYQFHRSAIMYAVLIPLFGIRLSRRHLGILLLFSLFLLISTGFSYAREFVSGLSQIEMFSKLDKYTSFSEQNTNVFGLQTIVSVVVSVLCLLGGGYIKKEYDRIYLFFLNQNIFGILILSFLWSIPTAYRLYNTFFFFNFILLYLLTFQNKVIKIVWMKFLCAFLFSITYFGTLLYCNIFLLMY